MPDQNLPADCAGSASDQVPPGCHESLREHGELLDELDREMRSLRRDFDALEERVEAYLADEDDLPQIPIM